MGKEICIDCGNEVKGCKCLETKGKRTTLEKIEGSPITYLQNKIKKPTHQDMIDKQHR